MGSVIRRRARSLVNRVRGRLERDAWARAYARGYRRPVRLDVLSGAVESRSVPVVMCLWNRPDRIDTILRQLDSQDGDVGVRLMLWNNKPSNDARYREAIASYARTGSLHSIEYRVSRQNLGGVARFFVARQLVREGSNDPFIMLDDDQDISSSFVGDLRAAYEPRTYAGWWAFMNHGSYVERSAVADGEPASYVGTGGSICDPALVMSPGFFEELPHPFAFVEDLWASARALKLGWRVRKVETTISFVQEELNQFNNILQLKVDFYEELADAVPLLRGADAPGSLPA